MQASLVIAFVISSDLFFCGLCFCIFANVPNNQSSSSLQCDPDRSFVCIVWSPGKWSDMEVRERKVT